MSYIFDEELAVGLVSALLATVPSVLLAIAAYVLSALAFYTIAVRRGLKNPWLAWIPVAGSYLVGSVSDQYRYVVRRERKSKRKILLTLSIVSTVLKTVAVVILVSVVGRAVSGVIWRYSEERILRELMDWIVKLLAVCLPICAVGIAYAIVRYMALYDIYRSLDPGNSTLYLVLSILVGVTEPFFLFFNRNKDDGMPPRRKPPLTAPDPPRPDPWEQTGPENGEPL